MNQHTVLYPQSHSWSSALGCCALPHTYPFAYLQFQLLLKCLWLQCLTHEAEIKEDGVYRNNLNCKVIDIIIMIPDHQFSVQLSSEPHTE